MKGRDFVQQLLDGTVLNEKHRKSVAQVTSELEYMNSHRRILSGGYLSHFVSFTADIAPTILKFHQIHIILRLLLEYAPRSHHHTLWFHPQQHRVPKAA